jgi:uncharacterized protein (DUF1499 family)
MFNLGRSGRAVLIAAAGLAIALITVLIPVQWKHTLDRLPRIHDITTDMDDPPSYVDALRLRTRTDHPLTYDGADVALKQRAAYPDVRPLFVKTSKSKTFETAKRVIRDLGLELAGASLEEGRLEAVDTSPLFGFKDDLVIRIRELSTGSRVDMRSKSRVGLSDLGQNAARIRRVSKALRSELGE